MKLSLDGPAERLHGCEHWLALSGVARQRSERQGWYSELCRTSAGEGTPSHVIDQVEVDVARISMADEVDRRGSDNTSAAPTRHESLRRVLVAYALHDPLTGYVQGMGDIAATALLSASRLDEHAEEAAFWWLVHVNEHLLPGFFAPGMAAVWTELGVLHRALVALRPHLATHLATVGWDLACFAPSWYLTLFQRILDPAERRRALTALAARRLEPSHLALGILLVSEGELLATSTFDEVTHILCSNICSLSRSTRPGVLRAAETAAQALPSMRLAVFRSSEWQGRAECRW